TDQIPSVQILEHYGLASGSTVRSKDFVRDFLSTIKNAVGGELTAYTDLLEEAREEATQRMITQARSMGANAVVGIRFATSSIAQGAAEIYVYGTAVKVG
ncbi:MAG: heavy metal-binding domain-containing protein, partial [Bdellovibrionales bacterium]|nr:heavy metal-binding domain-containing protein [Bdellovibrionales bacterium]